MTGTVPVLYWWWYASGGAGSITATAFAQGTQTLLLPEAPAHYDRIWATQLLNAIEQRDVILPKTTGDIYQPNGIVVRQRTVFPWVSFTAGDATPSVASGRNFKTANDVPTTIIDFDDGIDGQEIRVRVDDSNTTVDFTVTSLVGNSGASYGASDGDQIIATYDATEGRWYCTVVQA